MNNTSCKEISDKIVAFTTRADAVLLCTDIITAFLNLFVCVTAGKLYKRTSDAVHLFILSMTLGDLLLTGFASPMETLSKRTELLTLEMPCYMSHFSNWLGLAASGLSMTMLNVDKLLYFQCPLHYSQWMAFKPSVALVLAIWTFGIAFVAVVMHHVVFMDACVLEASPGWYDAYMIVFCFTPVISSAMLSAYLYVVSKRHSYNQVGMDSHRLKLKSLIFIFATTAWTTFSLLPFRIFSLVRIHFTFEETCTWVYEMVAWLGWMLWYLLMINPAVNPIITLTIYAPYRKAIVAVFGKLRHHLKVSRSKCNSRNTRTLARYATANADQNVIGEPADRDSNEKPDILISSE